MIEYKIYFLDRVVVRIDISMIVLQDNNCCNRLKNKNKFISLNFQADKFENRIIVKLKIYTRNIP